MNLSSKSVTIISLLAFHSGCTTKHTFEPRQQDPIKSALVEVAEEIRLETVKLQEILQNEPPVSYELDLSDPVLDKHITVLEYAGSPETLLEHVAKSMDYNFIATDNSDQFQHTVIINVQRIRTIDLIREIAAQLGTGINLELSIKHREIRLVY